MKKLVWIAGALLLFAIVFPNGVDVSAYLNPKAADVEIDAKPDAKIVELLSGAASADKARVVGVYLGLRTVLTRDAGKRVNTTEKLEELQANTLQMAIEKPGKYPGLDDAIEAVFQNAVKSAKADASVVNPMTPEIQAAVIKACEIVIVSAQQ